MKYQKVFKAAYPPPLQKKRKDELKVVSSLSFSKGHGGEERTKSGTQKRVHKHAVVRACNLATCVTCSSQEGGFGGGYSTDPEPKTESMKENFTYTLMNNMMRRDLKGKI